MPRRSVMFLQQEIGLTLPATGSISYATHE
jgi:hypothetical protein